MPTPTLLRSTLASRSLTLLLVAALAGCGASGSSGSSSSTSGSSRSGGTSTTGTPGTATTLTYAITSPARGAFVSGSPQVTLEGTADSPSLIASVTVNGAQASIVGTTWSIPATLAFGINTFSLKVIDNSGNTAHTTWSVLYSPTFIDATQLVSNSAELRLSQNAIAKITPAVVQTLAASGALQAAIQQAAGANLGGIASINSVSFGTPVVTVTLVQGGVDVVIELPNLSIDASVLGQSLQINASTATVAVTFDLAVSNGAFVATLPATRRNAQANPSVSFSGGVGGTLANLVAPLISSAMQTVLPGALTTALNDAIQPHSVTMAGYTATLEAKPNALAIDAANFKATGDANLTILGQAGPAHPTAPGSASRNGAASGAPALATQHDVSLCVREDLINRVLFAGWESGATGITIDQAWLAAHGVNLPVPLDASLLVPFFPALGTLKPGGGPMPVALHASALLPPTVLVTGAPSLVTTQVGEMQVGFQIDLGQGYVDVLTVSVSGELGTTLSISNNALQIGVGQPTACTVDLLANPFGLSIPDVNQFINTMLPLLSGFAAQYIPPVPLPAIPGGLQPRNLDIRQDGAGADFLTIEGDL